MKGQNPMSAIAQHKPTFEIISPSKTPAPSHAEIDILQASLNEAERVARQLQSRVSAITTMGSTMTPEDSLAIALKEARDQARGLRAALDEARAAVDRERLAAVPDRFAECAKTFGAETGSNGWASCSDVPADALAACLDPMIVVLTANETSVPRIFNQIRQIVERAVPVACAPFMPRELFDASSPVRAAILERIRQAVKNAQDRP
jgi:hypothetical protein